ncbi:hypothetical protein BT96DRAFT_438020 [Gymnopus androsaceus JB14]|uniref:Carbohydrate esterase family 16 protein n=1 Tax=Gymnopus androsaceus JB14 TaxID=1447944 RepID=A0A6A4GR94_9AGAR|nr:hypothetical protein BT96DRAFT_438020 [Gymnopus androsaceus JB14]
MCPKSRMLCSLVTPTQTSLDSTVLKMEAFLARTTKRYFHLLTLLQTVESSGPGIWAFMAISPSGTMPWEARSVPTMYVIGGQAAWFVQDHVLNATENSPQTLDIPPSEFVVDIFIGTNDVGVNNFITDGQAFNVSLKSLATCQLQSIRNLHALGARNFILNSLIPLQLTELYSNSSAPNIYWPALHNGTNWHKRAFNFANSLNELLKDGVSNLATEWESEPETSVEFFDTYAFFEEMYNHPAMFFNGSIPANVTGHCHQCPDPDNFLDCGIGDCTLAQRDSYMWWDELHPSEQTGRNLAAEIWRKIQGVSKF